MKQRESKGENEEEEKANGEPFEQPQETRREKEESGAKDGSALCVYKRTLVRKEERFRVEKNAFAWRRTLPREEECFRMKRKAGALE